MDVSMYIVACAIRHGRRPLGRCDEAFDQFSMTRTNDRVEWLVRHLLSATATILDEKHSSPGAC